MMEWELLRMEDIGSLIHWISVISLAIGLSVFTFRKLVIPSFRVLGLGPMKFKRAPNATHAAGNAFAFFLSYRWASQSSEEDDASYPNSQELSE